MNTYVFDPVKPVAETKFGKLRGVCYGGVNMFMGIKYADAKRFCMPVEPETWEGVKDAYRYGHISPQLGAPTPPPYYRGLFMHQIEGEDCQNLNVWAPKGKEGEKKPVFVWLHGGGFLAGNALEEYSFDGFHLAHYGDVVFVSVNHRLNILGYMNLSDYGEEFSNTPNLGLADLVAALKWVHENIEAFGGDPENVTICGHSGGGGKVLARYQMKEAAPYFQRGICLSGATPEAPASEIADTKVLAKAMLDEIGITKENIKEVYTVPYETLVKGYKKVAQKLYDEGHYVIFEPLKNDYFKGFPPFYGFDECSNQKPLIISTTMGEFGRCDLSADEKAALGEAEREAYVRGVFGEHADRLIELFRKAYPTHSIIDLVYLDTVFRMPTINAAIEKAKYGSDNTYVYLCAYNMPEDDFVPMWHGGDVCYAFMNEDRVYVANEEMYGQKMSRIFSSMILNYCKTGNPNTEELPHWDTFSEEHPVTMVIDKESEQKTAFDKELMDCLMSITEPFQFKPMYADNGVTAQIQ